MNGPGTCVPIGIAALIYKSLGVSTTRILYVETFARVYNLSLTGKIMYFVSDVFMVQWKDLTIKYPKARYRGRLV